MNKNSVLILDIRKGTNCEEELKQYFDMKEITNGLKHIRYCCKLL